MQFNIGSDHLRRNRGESENVIDMLTSMKNSQKRKRPYAADAGFCPTKNWFMINVEQDPSVVPATLKLYQGIGNGIEDVIVEGFKESGKLLSTQISLPNPSKSFGIDIGGYMDMLAFDRFGRLALYEIKSTTSLPDKPKTNHLSQAMTYACLGGFDIVYIVYVARTVQNFPDPTPLIRVFELDVHSMMHEFMTTIVLSCHSLNDSKAPLRPIGFRKSYECSYCPFHQMCWKEEGFEFQSAGDAAVRLAEAEKTADELIVLRGQFLKSSLHNAIGSAPLETKKTINGLLLKTPEQLFAVSNK